MTNDNLHIAKDMKSILKNRLKEDLKEVILFGSQLSNNSNYDSDYDFLIILKQKANWKTESEISDLCYEIDLKYGIITDTHILGEDELSLLRGKQPVFLNAINNGYYA